MPRVRGEKKRTRQRTFYFLCRTFPTLAPPSTPVLTTSFPSLNPHQSKFSVTYVLSLLSDLFLSFSLHYVCLSRLYFLFSFSCLAPSPPRLRWRHSNERTFERVARALDERSRGGTERCHCYIAGKTVWAWIYFEMLAITCEFCMAGKDWRCNICLLLCCRSYWSVIIIIVITGFVGYRIMW